MLRGGTKRDNQTNKKGKPSFFQKMAKRSYSSDIAKHRHPRANKTQQLIVFPTNAAPG